MEKQKYGKVIYTCRTSDSLNSLLRSIEKINSKDTLIQIFNPSHIISKFHIYAAYMNTQTAFKNGSNIAKKESTEMLLFTAMTTQINYALDMLSVTDTKNFILFSSSDRTLKKFGDLTLSEFKPSKSDIKEKAMRFGIKFKTESELNKKILLKMAKSRL